MKKLIFTICLFICVINLNSNVATVTKISSGATNACADAICNSIRAQNSLSQPDWCALWLIMHNTQTTDSQKWTAIGAIGNLTNLYNAVNSCSATLVANNFDNFDSAALFLVSERLRDSLTGAPNVGCNDYYIGCGQIYDDNIFCMKAACNYGMAYGWEAFCVAVAICDAKMIRSWYNLCQQYPGCGPVGGAYTPPKSYIFEFDGIAAGCE